MPDPERHAEIAKNFVLPPFFISIFLEKQVKSTKTLVFLIQNHLKTAHSHIFSTDGLFKTFFDYFYVLYPTQSFIS